MRLRCTAPAYEGPPTGPYGRHVFVAAAVCPHPPLLVPQLAAGAAPDLDEVRAACDAAVAGLLAERPDEIVVVGADPEGGTYPATAGASMQPYGVDLRVGGPEGELPLALAIGAWLLDRADLSPLVSFAGTRRRTDEPVPRARPRADRGHRPGRAAGDGGRLGASLHVDHAPYGVGYVVANWRCRTE